MLPLQTTGTYLEGLPFEERTTEKDEWNEDTETRTKAHRRFRRRRKRKLLEGSRRRGFLKRRIASTSISPSLTIYSVTVGLVEQNTLFIPVEIQTQKNGKSVEKAMIDSGAGGKFIDQNFARNSRMEIQNLDEPLKALNVNGTENKRGTIRH